MKQGMNFNICRDLMRNPILSSCCPRYVDTKLKCKSKCDSSQANPMEERPLDFKTDWGQIRSFTPEVEPVASQSLHPSQFRTHVFIYMVQSLHLQPAKLMHPIKVAVRDFPAILRKIVFPAAAHPKTDIPWTWEINRCIPEQISCRRKEVSPIAFLLLQWRRQGWWHGRSFGHDKYLCAHLILCLQAWFCDYDATTKAA